MPHPSDKSASTAPVPPPVRLRSAQGAHIGTTAFFRNRPLLETVLGEMRASGQTEWNVLFHSCSLGAEVYSFLMAILLDPILKVHRIRCQATDIEPAFLEMARGGVYPRGILQGLRKEEQAFFVPVNEEAVRVGPELAKRVTFLPACSFQDYPASESFDLIFLLNALLYVERSVQSQSLDRIAAYNSRWLITTGFHADAIKADLCRNGYQPVLENQEAIHEHWTDRRVVTNGGKTIPGVIFHPSSLPRFSRIPDYEYKYCAVFAKAEATKTV
jgi:hypothetical protein